MKHQAGLSQPDFSISTLAQDLQQLTSAHNSTEKAVSVLANKIEMLQLQETKLFDQIQMTSDALERHTAHPTHQTHDHKLNNVLYGIEELSSKTSRYERQQGDIKAVLETLNSIKVQMNPDHIVDCFRLGKFNQTQSRSRPILIRFLHTLDVNTILANKKYLSTPLMIKPDLSPQEKKVESALLKECWSLIQNGHNCTQIKLSNNRIFVNGHLYGEVTNGELKCSSLPLNSTSQQTDASNLQQPRLQCQPKPTVSSSFEFSGYRMC